MKQDRLVFFTAGIVLARLLAPEVLGQFQFQRLESFGSLEQTGAHPNRLVEASDGAFYGTTSDGGANGAGTLFKLQRDGSGFTILHHFLRTEGNVSSALIAASDGALYGTSCGGADGAVTVFKLQRNGGRYTVLHSFSQADGGAAGLLASLVEGSDGTLYGTTSGGGSNPCGTDGCGTVFKLKKDGSGYRVLHNFGGTFDGANPLAALVEGSDGLLYGTTRSGGITNGNVWGEAGNGTVFKLDKDGNGYAVLRSFTGGVGDGMYPSEALLQGSDGSLYGTTDYGGADGTGSGTVFKLNKDGSGYAVLWSFSGNADVLLRVRLVEGNDGALYGTTLWDGFKLNKDGGGYAVLRTFPGETDDGRPKTGLVSGLDGALYGTTWDGGNMGLGTIFVLRPQPVMLPPLVSGDGNTVRFTSMPGSTHRLQLAGALSGSWLTLTNLLVPTNGVAEFIDHAPPDPSRFYRTVVP